MKLSYFYNLFSIYFINNIRYGIVQQYDSSVQQYIFLKAIYIHNIDVINEWDLKHNSNIEDVLIKACTKICNSVLYKKSKLNNLDFSFIQKYYVYININDLQNLCQKFNNNILNSYLILSQL